MPIAGSSGGLSSGGVGGGGAQGPQGATGSQGNQGHQGNQGNQGTQGSGGSQGVQGAQGSTGAQGPQGAQGGTSVPNSYLLLSLAATISDITGNTTLTWTEVASAGSDIELLVDTETVQFLTAGRYSWYMEIQVKGDNSPPNSGNIGMSVFNQQTNAIMDPINDSFDYDFSFVGAPSPQTGVFPWSFPMVAFAVNDQLQWGTSGGRAYVGTPSYPAGNTFVLIRREA